MMSTLRGHDIRTHMNDKHRTTINSKKQKYQTYLVNVKPNVRLAVYITLSADRIQDYAKPRLSSLATVKQYQWLDQFKHIDHIRLYPHLLHHIFPCGGYMLPQFLPCRSSTCICQNGIVSFYRIFQQERIQCFPFYFRGSSHVLSNQIYEPGVSVAARLSGSKSLVNLYMLLMNFCSTVRNCQLVERESLT